MQRFLLFNFVVAIGWAKPDASHLTPHRFFHPRIESIKPSIEIASFTVQTEVPLHQISISNQRRQPFVTPQFAQPSTFLPHQQLNAVASSTVHIQPPPQVISIYNSRAYLPPERLIQQYQVPTASPQQTYNQPIETIRQNLVTTSSANEPPYEAQAHEQRSQPAPQFQEIFQNPASFPQVEQEGYLPPTLSQQQQLSEPRKQQPSIFHQSANLERQHTIQEAYISTPLEPKREGYLPPGKQTYSSSATLQPIRLTQSSPASVQQFIYSTPAPEKQRHSSNHPNQQFFVSAIRPQEQQAFISPVPTQQSVLAHSQNHQFIVHAAPNEPGKSLVPSAGRQQTFDSPLAIQQSFHSPITVQQTHLEGQTPTQPLFSHPITEPRTYAPQNSVLRSYLPASTDTRQEGFNSNTETKQKLVHSEPMQLPDLLGWIKRDLLLPNPTQMEISQHTQASKQTPAQQYSTSQAHFDYNAFVPPPPLPQNTRRVNFPSSRNTNGYLPPFAIHHNQNVPNTNQQSYSSQTISVPAHSSADPPPPPPAQQEGNSPGTSAPISTQIQQVNTQAQTSETIIQTDSPQPPSRHYHSAPPSAQQQQAPIEASINFDPSKMSSFQIYFAQNEMTHQNLKKPSAFERKYSKQQSVESSQIPKPNSSIPITKESHEVLPSASSDGVAINDRVPFVQKKQDFNELSSKQSSPSDGDFDYTFIDSISTPGAPNKVINSDLDPTIQTQNDIQTFDSTPESIEGQQDDASHHAAVPSNSIQFESQMTEIFDHPITVQEDSNLGNQYDPNGGYTYQRKKPSR